jgi:undecaprenol kinase/diacylglycerol kinase (ATP)
MKNQPFSISKRIKSFSYAFSGLRTLIKEEHNALLHLIAAIAVIVLGFLLEISTFEWIAIVFAIGFVFILELINTSIENIADFISPERHSTIKKIKDLAAGAVLIGAITALTIGCLIFIPKLIELC